ncbi:MAG: hypothetical protein V2I33_19805 [Kangiellaceae bacterium]|jgi:hypothetical protein|nr:hypothetical protein [Kangiellaceae bacterium]
MDGSVGEAEEVVDDIVPSWASSSLQQLSQSTIKYYVKLRRPITTRVGIFVIAVQMLQILSVVFPLDENLPHNNESLGPLWKVINFSTRPDVLATWMSNDMFLTSCMLLFIHAFVFALSIGAVYWSTAKKQEFKVKLMGKDSATLYWGSLVTTIFFNLMSIPAIMHSAIAIN